MYNMCIFILLNFFESPKFCETHKLLVFIYITRFLKHKLLIFFNISFCIPEICETHILLFVFIYIYDKILKT